jgi:hypothetical protein
MTTDVSQFGSIGSTSRHRKKDAESSGKGKKGPRDAKSRLSMMLPVSTADENRSRSTSMVNQNSSRRPGESGNHVRMMDNILMADSITGDFARMTASLAMASTSEYQEGSECTEDTSEGTEGSTGSLRGRASPLCTAAKPSNDLSSVTSEEIPSTVLEQLVEPREEPPKSVSSPKEPKQTSQEKDQQEQQEKEQEEEESALSTDVETRGLGIEASTSTPPPSPDANSEQTSSVPPEEGVIAVKRTPSSGSTTSPKLDRSMRSKSFQVRPSASPLSRHSGGEAADLPNLDEIEHSTTRGPSQSILDDFPELPDIEGDSVQRQQPPDTLLSRWQESVISKASENLTIQQSERKRKLLDLSVSMKDVRKRLNDQLPLAVKTTAQPDVPRRDSNSILVASPRRLVDFVKPTTSLSALIDVERTIQSYLELSQRLKEQLSRLQAEEDTEKALGEAIQPSLSAILSSLDPLQSTQMLVQRSREKVSCI